MTVVWVILACFIGLVVGVALMFALLYVATAAAVGKGLGW